MEAKVKQTPENANPVLSVDKNGCVLYSNDAGNPLLNEWDVEVGEKLPSSIIDLVQRVISRNNPKKIEVKVGNRMYLIVFHPLPEQELVSISGFDISDQREIAKEIQINEEGYQEVFKLIEEGISIGELILDEKGHPIDVITLDLNPAFEKHSGIRREQIIGKRITEIFPIPEQIWLERYHEVIRSGTGKHFEEYNTSVDRWFDVYASPMGGNRFITVFGDITERKQVENSLYFERLQFMSIFDGMEDMVYVADPFTYEILYVNKALKEKFDGKYEGGVCYRKFQRKDSPCNFCTNPIILKERDKTYLWEYYNPIINRHLMIMDRLIKWPDGRDVRLEIAKDITERKKAEEALQKANETLEEKVLERTLELKEAYGSLKESGKNFAEAQKMAHIGNWVLDIKTDKAYWSEELYRIFRRDPKQLAPSFNEYLSYIHPEDRHHVYNALHKALTEKSSLSIDFRIRLVDGEERTVHMLSEIVFNEKNYPVRIKGIVQDITERKKAEEKIKNLANIVESSEDAIGTISLDGIITSWNKGAEKVYGYSTEEILGKHVSILSPSHLKKETMKLIELIKQGECYHQYESLRIGKNGNKIFVSITYSPVLDNNGNLTAVSIIGRDITERKKAEETLAKIEIARKQEIHHRIKNNLQIISSLLDLQAEHFRNKECFKRSEILEAFRESQDRVISMALIHEELHKGGEIDTLNFSHYIKELAENLLLTYRLGNEGISLNLDIEKDIFFDMDISVPLGMIINELISNSLKYAFSGRDKGEIQIKLNREENGECKTEGFRSTSYVLSVSDNGIGIPEDLGIEDLDSLGLQLVTTLVDQLDGDFELKRNNGTEFIIKFTVTEKDNLEFEKPII